MIYLLAVAILLALIGFVRRARNIGVRAAMLDLVISAAFGWLCGIFIGIGARLGMWTIPFFNGAEPQVTPDGTAQVLLVFSLYGIMLGVIYEMLFRSILQKSGLAFGALVMLCTWYPLSAAGVQQLNFSPEILPLILVTGLVMALMFVPFGVLLELLLRRWHEFRL